MSQTKAQLIQPIGVVTASGVVVSGVMTAATFDGDIVGSATSIIQGTNLNLGAFNATSFAGDFTGNATGIITSSAIKVGQLTASSFVGDFTGTATSMARGTGFEAGTVTSTAANVTYTVTVGSKTGGGNAFYLDGLEAPNPTLYPGATYTFDQSAGTNATHPLRFATAADAAGSTEYTDGVTTNGTPGSAGAWTKIVVPRNAPTPLYYYCTNHSGMGDSINITNKLQGAVTGDVTGSATGIAGTVVQGTNIHVGVVTATSLYGDGSNLTGIAATNFNTQTVTINSGITTVDLSAGNMITIDQERATTVSFANTSEAMDVTVIRPGGGGSYNISYSTGRVQFDGTGDYLSLAASSDLQLDDDFTVEFWVYPQYSNTAIRQTILANNGNFTSETSTCIQVNHSSYVGKVALWDYDTNSGVPVVSSSGTVGVNEWSHVAVVRSSGTITIYINGVEDGTATNTNTMNFGTGATWIGQVNVGPETFEGILSNLRVVKGTAVYTSNFVPPSAALTNITNTKLLCCQSTSSTTAATVTPGTITANGDPTADSTTVSKSGTYNTQGSITWPSSIKWNNGTAPSWDTTNTLSSEWNQIQLITRDSGVTWYGWENAEVEYSVKYHLYAWGNDEGGVQGQNTNYVHLSSPTQIPGVWSHINVQRDQKRNVMATKPDGSLWFWGNGQYGMSGMNNRTSRSSPIQIGTDTNWSLYNLGGSGSGINVTKTDGTLWTWGGNWNGNLGLNHVDNRSSPTQVGTETTWVTGQYGLMTTSDTQTSAAIKTDGTLWTWGNNSEGILGLNAPVPTKQSSPTQVGTNTTWSKVFGGKEWISAIKTDGTLWTWGRNSVGQLGLNNKTSRSSPTQIGTDTTWQNLNSGGYGLNFATKTDGTGWLWGYGEYGNFGNNTGTYRRSSPTQLPGSWNQGTVALFPFTMATKTDGTIWAWGRNNDQGGGNLGQNNRTTYSSPKQIGTGTAWRYCWGAFAASFALKDAE